MQTVILIVLLVLKIFDTLLIVAIAGALAKLIRSQRVEDQDKDAWRSIIEKRRASDNQNRPPSYADPQMMPPSTIEERPTNWDGIPKNTRNWDGIPKQDN